MQKINTSTTPLRIARRRMAGLALVAGIVASGMLAPLTVGATEYDGAGVLTSDQANVLDSDQMRRQDEVIFLTPEEEYLQEMDRLERQAAVQPCTEAGFPREGTGIDEFASCQPTRPEEAAELARLARERQARATAEAYAADQVYTLYDAESVLASNLPEATKRNILGMIAPTIYLAMTNGPDGVI